MELEIKILLRLLVKMPQPRTLITRAAKLKAISLIYRCKLKITERLPPRSRMMLLSMKEVKLRALPTISHNR